MVFTIMYDLSKCDKCDNHYIYNVKTDDVIPQKPGGWKLIIKR